MGKLIAHRALEEGHKVPYKITSENADELDRLENVDVAIEFTRPEAALENYRKLAAQKIPIVTGTTGWNDRIKDVEKLVADNGIPFFYASNFSIGVNISFKVNELMAELMGSKPEYKAQIDEWHHTGKKDAPSGTALSFANDILANHKTYQKSQLDPDEITEGILPVYAFRENDIPGTHRIQYESEEDKITLTHEAKSREGFAKGALAAAKFIIGKPKGVYTMNDLIKDKL
jgi:4-hydroxy-tetrahydrodipicolinate reductase